MVISLDRRVVYAGASDSRRCPGFATTRWHGTTSATGLLARATARTADGATARATSSMTVSRAEFASAPTTPTPLKCGAANVDRKFPGSALRCDRDGAKHGPERSRWLKVDGSERKLLGKQAPHRVCREGGGLNAATTIADLYNTTCARSPQRTHVRPASRSSINVRAFACGRVAGAARRRSGVHAPAIRIRRCKSCQVTRFRVYCFQKPFRLHAQHSRAREAEHESKRA